MIHRVHAVAAAVAVGTREAREEGGAERGIGIGRPLTRPRWQVGQSTVLDRVERQSRPDGSAIDSGFRHTSRRTLVALNDISMAFLLLVLVPVFCDGEADGLRTWQYVRDGLKERLGEKVDKSNLPLGLQSRVGTSHDRDGQVEVLFERSLLCPFFQQDRTPMLRHIDGPRLL